MVAASILLRPVDSAFYPLGRPCQRSVDDGYIGTQYTPAWFPGRQNAKGRLVPYGIIISVTCPRAVEGSALTGIIGRPNPEDESEASSADSARTQANGEEEAKTDLLVSGGLQPEDDGDWQGEYP